MERFGDATIGILADGALTLAMIWESAWTQGKGNTRIATKNLTAINQTAFQALYQDATFVPSP